MLADAEFDASAPLPTADRNRLRRWQGRIVVLLVVGYAGYYLCRVNLAVVTPRLIAELAAAGMTRDAARERIGAIVSLGTLAYAFGKFLGGGLGDFLGGRSNFLVGMFGAVVFTVAFALGGSIPIFTLAWMGNRLVQSFGWSGLVKVASRWFDWRSIGGVMGVLSLSYLFGDAASKFFLASLLDFGLSWRQLFFISAAVLATWWVVCFCFLKESPAEVGLQEGEANPANVFGKEGEEARPTGVLSVLVPLLRSRSFLYVCVLSMTFTLLRETFNTWTTTYFTAVVGLTEGGAARYAALFPLLGGVAVLLAGVAGDRLGRLGRAIILVSGLLLTGLALGGLGILPTGGPKVWPIVGVATAGFLIMGPYSYLAGAMAVDFGGKRGGATASGVIDGLGYVAATLAGSGVAKLVTAWGWSTTFVLMAVFAWVSALIAFLYLREQARLRRVEHALG
jgi:OPA family glycerol-3-phosphate transporter-like MFS transporter